MKKMKKRCFAAWGTLCWAFFAHCILSGTALSAQSYPQTAAITGDLPAMGMFAATNAFPYNSLLQVTNLDNGISATVTVIGTVSQGSINVLLTQEAAARLGIAQGQVGRIKMELKSLNAAAQPSLFSDGRSFSGDPDYDPRALVEQNMLPLRTQVYNPPQVVSSAEVAPTVPVLTQTVPSSPQPSQSPAPTMQAAAQPAAQPQSYMTFPPVSVIEDPVDSYVNQPTPAVTPQVTPPAPDLAQTMPAAPASPTPAPVSPYPNPPTMTPRVSVIDTPAPPPPAAKPELSTMSALPPAQPYFILPVPSSDDVKKKADDEAKANTVIPMSDLPSAPEAAMPLMPPDDVHISPATPYSPSLAMTVPSAPHENAAAVTTPPAVLPSEIPPVSPSVRPSMTSPAPADGKRIAMTEIPDTDTTPPVPLSSVSLNLPEPSAEIADAHGAESPAPKSETTTPLAPAHDVSPALPLPKDTAEVAVAPASPTAETEEPEPSVGDYTQSLPEAAAALALERSEKPEVVETMPEVLLPEVTPHLAAPETHVTLPKVIVEPPPPAPDVTQSLPAAESEPLVALAAPRLAMTTPPPPAGQQTPPPAPDVTQSLPAAESEPLVALAAPRLAMTTPPPAGQQTPPPAPDVTQSLPAAESEPLVALVAPRLVMSAPAAEKKNATATTLPVPVTIPEEGEAADAPEASETYPAVKLAEPEMRQTMPTRAEGAALIADTESDGEGGNDAVSLPEPRVSLAKKTPAPAAETEMSDAPSSRVTIEMPAPVEPPSLALTMPRPTGVEADNPALPPVKNEEWNLAQANPAYQMTEGPQEDALPQPPESARTTITLDPAASEPPRATITLAPEDAETDVTVVSPTPASATPSLTQPVDLLPPVHTAAIPGTVKVETSPTSPETASPVPPPPERITLTMPEESVVNTPVKEPPVKEPPRTTINLSPPAESTEKNAKTPSSSLPEIEKLDKGAYYVQLAAAREKGELEKYAGKFNAGYPVAIENAADKLYRLVLGPLNEGESNALLARVAVNGYKDAFIRKN